MRAMHDNDDIKENLSKKKNALNIYEIQEGEVEVITKIKRKHKQNKVGCKTSREEFCILWNDISQFKVVKITR